MEHLGCWPERHHFLLAEARQDLEDGAPVRNCLLAFAGEEPLLVAWLRPFAPGAHRAALVEVLALALPLGADRLAVSMPGRMWSLADPIPPVLPGVGDLRQRVVVVEEADAGSWPIATRTTAYPYEVGGDGLPRWLEPLAEEGVTGPVAALLADALAGGLTASDAELCQQARRVAELGHLVAVAPGVLDADVLHG